MRQGAPVDGIVTAARRSGKPRPRGSRAAGSFAEDQGRERPPRGGKGAPACRRRSGDGKTQAGSGRPWKGESDGAGRRSGGQGRTRTADAGLFRAALYQLSYLASPPCSVANAARSRIPAAVSCATSAQPKGGSWPVHGPGSQAVGNGPDARPSSVAQGSAARRWPGSGGPSSRSADPLQDSGTASGGERLGPKPGPTMGCRSLDRVLLQPAMTAVPSIRRFGIGGLPRPAIPGGKSARGNPGG